MTDLTPREQQVCDLLASGYSNKEIALMLGHISHRTVEDHRATIMEKYEVRNVAELILKIHGLGKYHVEAEASVEA